MCTAPRRATCSTPTGFYVGGPNELNFKDLTRTNTRYSEANYMVHENYADKITGVYNPTYVGPDGVMRNYTSNLLYDLIEAVWYQQYSVLSGTDVWFNDEMLNQYMHSGTGRWIERPADYRK